MSFRQLTNVKEIVRPSTGVYSETMEHGDREAGGKNGERREAILDAAFQVFAAYGYRRTSMDDIARAAGLSRPALYLHYRNKEDIFRSGAERYFRDALARMEAALFAPGQSEEAALIAAFRAKDGDLMEVVFGTPHGGELMDAGMTVTSDLFQAAERQKIAILARWLSTLDLPEDLGPPEAVARTIMAAAMGLKFPGQTLEGYRQGQRQLARLFARALAAPV